ncbi:hypothetical protein MES5069_550114 [Mesorhizobium escarrei]|uniref:Uncharacterized protein n=1 Tax=Mesorhizobium escarrei TaxID=666018 RepID=A0ABN8KC56_9HYPH|nr:hypothetical protein MES5069_550114 [Mesorhizobium escarrei]
MVGMAACLLMAGARRSRPLPDRAVSGAGAGHLLNRQAALAGAMPFERYSYDVRIKAGYDLQSAVGLDRLRNR